MEDKRCSCGSSRRPDKSKWSRALKWRHTHSAASIVPRLHVLKSLRACRGGRAAFSSSKKNKQKKQNRKGKVGIRVEEIKTCVFFHMRCKVSFSIVALGHNWDILQCTCYGKSYSVLVPCGISSKEMYKEERVLVVQIKMSPSLFYYENISFIASAHYLHSSSSSSLSCFFFMFLSLLYTKTYPYFNLKSLMEVLKHSKSIHFL